MKKIIAVIGAFDSKQMEYQYLINKIHEYGCETFLIDLGVLKEPEVLKPDISASFVAETGGGNLQEFRKTRIGKQL